MWSGQQVQVFFDGDCPLCVREINMLKRLDRKGRIWFTDIAAPDFRAEDWGKTQSELMAKIQGRLSDGQWIEGVEVFRQLYSQVGFRWLVGVTRLPLFSHALDWGYQIFAKNRLRMTGRCEDGVCEVPSEKPLTSKS